MCNRNKLAVAAREETERSEGSKGICTVTGPILLKLVKLTHENIEKEHICCAISNNKDIQVMSKKNWLKDRLDEGLVILSSRKKMGFLSDPKYMDYKGFQTVDTAEPYLELMVLPFGEDAPLPRFRDSVRRHEDMPEGFVLYYTNQCPFTAKYVPMLAEMAKARNAVFRSAYIQTREDAQNAPLPLFPFSMTGSS